MVQSPQVDLLSIETLFKNLAKPFHVKLVEGPKCHDLVLLETFDWRLHKAGYALYHDGADLRFTSPGDNSPEEAVPLPLEKRPVMLEDLPEGLRPKLSSIIKMRALIPIATLPCRHYKMAILNEDDKTVVRLEVNSYGSEGLGRITARAERVRGYDSELAIIKNFLKKDGFQSNETPYLAALKSAGRKAGDYSGKLNLHLDGQQKSDTAVRIIYRRLLDIIRTNVDGTLKDIDTEFLHDFRVAVRRTRSGLSQFKGVFPEPVVLRAKEDFSLLGKWTNEVRDLDVFLLAKEDYRDLLPDDMKPDLDQFFQELEARRSDALKVLSKNLRSEQFAGILQRWDAYLEQAPIAPLREAPNAMKPIQWLAGKRIYKKYLRVREMGLAIHPGTPDQNLHDLRIECKKLRYLLEFFTSLYPDGMVDDLIKRLKKLQTLLGDFNDLCVQREELAVMAMGVKPTQNLRKVMLAIGLLMGRLYEHQITVKEDCIAGLDKFINDETHTRFRYFKRHAGGKS